MTVFAGDIINAADVNRRVITVTATTNGSTTSGATELAVDIGAGIVIAGRTYRLKWVFKYASTATDRYVIRVREGSGIGGLEIESNVFIVPGTGNTWTEILEADWVAASSGTATFTGTVAKLTGSGTLTPQGTTTSHRSLTADYAD